MSVARGKTHLATPGQTVGPFFAFGLDYAKMHEVVFPHSPGAIVAGRHRASTAPVRRSPTRSSRSGARTPTAAFPRARGALRRDDHTFTGFGRAATTDDGHYEFWTRNPGSVDGRGAVLRRDRVRARPARQAAHAHLPARGRRPARRRPAALLARRPRSAIRSSQRARPTADSTTTSDCRARRRPCSLPSEWARLRRRSALAGDGRPRRRRCRMPPCSTRSSPPKSRWYGRAAALGD